MPDGRSVGFADYGPAPGDDHIAVLWCHGGPGSRLEPETLAPAAAAGGFRLIGIDRPGYGLSTPQPGRTIAGWVPDGLAVADHLGIDRFIVVGVSTGGAYSLALAANAPDRVIGVVACCALTDMRWAEGKAMLDQGQIQDIWNAPNRDAALEIAADAMGEDGSKLGTQATDARLPPADMALFNDLEWLTGLMNAVPAMFAHGVTGYTDDRLADGPGWGTFGVDRIACPVVVLHGALDSVVPVAHAHYTAKIVPGARLRVVDDLGHFSIIGEVVGQLPAVRSGSAT